MRATRPAHVLLAAAARAAGASPYYRRVLSTPPADWASVPCTLPRDLMRDGPRFAATPAVTVYASSGTSGRAKPAFFTARDRAGTVRRTIQSLIGSGVTGSDTLVVAHGFGIWLIGSDFSSAGEELGLRVLPIGKGPSVVQSAQLMREYGATVIATSPSYARRLAVNSGSRPGDLGVELGVRMLLLSGEAISEVSRRDLGRAWGVEEIRTYYGTAEFGHLGCDVRGDTCVRLSDDFGYEILVDGEPADLRPGVRGELVVTTLFQEGMPLVRYRTGDLVEVGAVAELAGLISLDARVLGRLESSVVLESGEKLSLWQLEEVLLGQAGIVDFRAELNEVEADRQWFTIADQLTIRCATAGPRPPDSEMDDVVLALRELSLDISAAGESLRFVVEWVTPEELIAHDGEGKPRRLVDRRSASVLAG
ncbi:phenylacetate--CoA ligase family protein [Micromonospora rubida]